MWRAAQVSAPAARVFQRVKMVYGHANMAQTTKPMMRVGVMDSTTTATAWLTKAFNNVAAHLAMNEPAERTSGPAV